MGKWIMDNEIMDNVFTSFLYLFEVVLISKSIIF